MAAKQKRVMAEFMAHLLTNSNWDKVKEFRMIANADDGTVYFYSATGEVKLNLNKALAAALAAASASRKLPSV